VARGINQVDQVVVAISRDILRDARQIFVRNFVKQRDTGRFDRDATILLVLTSIRQTRITGVFLRDDTSRRDQGIRERGFALLLFQMKKDKESISLGSQVGPGKREKRKKNKS